MCDPKMQFKAPTVLAAFSSDSLDQRAEPARATLERRADSLKLLKYYEDLRVEILKFRGCLLYLPRKIRRTKEM